MSTWSDEEDHPTEGDERAGDFREDVAPADPTPVTDAMVNPKPAGGAPRAHLGDDSVDCRVCGQANHAGASYCLACGVRLSMAAPDETGPPSDSDGAAPEEWSDDAFEAGFDPAAGLIDLEEASPSREVTAKDDRESSPEDGRPRITGRQILWGLLAVAIVVLLVVTFIGGDDPPVSTTTPAEVLATQALEQYATDVDGIASAVAELGDSATTINVAWDAEEAAFDATLTSLETLAAQASAIPGLVDAIDVPEGADAATHQRIVTSAATLEAAAGEMVEGLQAPDTGEARRAALTKFDAAVTEFGSLSRAIAQAVPSSES